MRKKVVSKEDVLLAAESIVKNEGVESCTMRAVAMQLGIAVGTLYNYFSSHDKLLEELFKMSWRKTAIKLDEIAALDKEPDEKLKKYSLTLIEEIRNRKGLGEALFGKQYTVTTLNNVQQILFKAISKSLKIIIKDTEKNKSLDSNSLDMISKWIIFAILEYKSSNEYDEDIFYNELIKRFI
jgi:AcrR family transcriptional regulator